MKKIGIIGAGRIGQALHKMLEVESNYVLSLADMNNVPVQDRLHVSDAAALKLFVEKHDAIVNALPHHHNTRVWRACVDANVSYFDFSEDVISTTTLQDYLAHYLNYNFHKGPFTATYMPQCGLAPGMINIIGAHLLKQFEAPTSLKLRVGALPQVATNMMKYYRTWSTAGLVNEYIKTGVAVEIGKVIKTQPLEGEETLRLNGIEYEAFNTSGGLSTMVDEYGEELDYLNYKTLRYPGHLDRIKFMARELQLADEPKEFEKLLEIIPETKEDLVILHAEAEGYIGNAHVHKYLSKTIMPKDYLTAIQRATAGGMAAVLDLWSRGRIDPGFVHQHDVDYAEILTTYAGRTIYG